MGSIVQAFKLEDAFLTGSTSSRFFNGESVNNHDLKEIYLALGKAIVSTGIIPNPPLFEKYDVSLPNIISASFARFFTKWDRLLAVLKSHSSPTFDSKRATTLILRLVIIDLTLRVFALYRLSNRPFSVSQPPMWATDNGAGKILRELLKKGGISREQLATRIEVSSTSIDNWFDGKIIPKPDNVSALARGFASLIPGESEQALKLQLTRHFGFFYLSNNISKIIGQEAVTNLVSSLYRMVWEITNNVKNMDRPPIEKVAGLEFEILRYGSDTKASHALLRNLALVEKDPEWKRDIIACTVSWSSRFQEITNECGLPKTAAGLAQDTIDVDPTYRDEADEDLANFSKNKQLRAQDYLHIAQGQLKTFNDVLDVDVTRLKMIVKQHPMSPKAHFVFGNGREMAKRSEDA